MCGLLLLLSLLVLLLAPRSAQANADPIAHFAKEMYGASASVFSRPTEGMLVLVDADLSAAEIASHSIFSRAAVLNENVASVVGRLDLSRAASHLKHSDISTLSAYGSLSDQVTQLQDDVAAYRFQDDQLSLLLQPAASLLSKPSVKHHVVLCNKDEDRLQGELALLETLGSANLAAGKRAPKILVAALGGLPPANSVERPVALARLARQLSMLQEKMSSTRPLFTVAFTGQTSFSTTRRTLSRVLQMTTPKFSGTDYVLMVWTMFVALPFFLHVFIASTNYFCAF